MPTKRQQLILDFVISFMKSNAFPPTRQEIADHFGFRSSNGAHEHLLALERKGLIQLTTGIARGIRIISKD